MNNHVYYSSSFLLKAIVIFWIPWISSTSLYSSGSGNAVFQKLEAQRNWRLNGSAWIFHSEKGNKPEPFQPVNTKFVGEDPVVDVYNVPAATSPDGSSTGSPVTISTEESTNTMISISTTEIPDDGAEEEYKTSFFKTTAGIITLSVGGVIWIIVGGVGHWLVTRRRPTPEIVSPYHKFVRSTSHTVFTG